MENGENCLKKIPCLVKYGKDNSLIWRKTGKTHVILAVCHCRKCHDWEYYSRISTGKWKITYRTIRFLVCL